jgi:hypothetical protein
MVDPKHRLGDAPVELKYRDRMNRLAVELDKIFNGENAGPRAKGQKDKRDTGFVLLVFPYSDGTVDNERCNFISNGADRKDIVALFREMIARFEGQPEIKGRA